MIGQTVHIGRKLKKLEESIRSSSEQQDGTVRLVTIPKAAKHASRHHCSLTLHKEEDGRLRLDIDVLGQNGMQLEGVKIPHGEKQVVVINGETVLLGFYTDFNVKVICEDAPQAKHVISHRVRETTEQLPPVPTSEATLGLDLEMDLDDEDEDAEVEVEEDADQEQEKLAMFAEVAEQRLPIKLESAASSPMTASSASKKRQGSRESSYQPVKRARLTSEIRSSPAPSPYAHQDDDGYPPEDSSESEDEDRVERRKNCKTDSPESIEWRR